MVYIYTKQSEINKFVGKELKVAEIEETLKNLGMDIKGVSDENNPELKVEITAEKMDMISSIGIARAIKHYLGFEKQVPRYKINKSKYKVIVESSVKEVRPYTVAALIKDTPMSQEILDEMIAIQEKMHESHGRNRKKAAIGIYPLKEITFPIKYLAESPSKINFRPLESDKYLSAKDILEKTDIGRKYKHLLLDYDKYPIFRDANNNILSMPPIVNAYDTGRVGLNDKDLFIECSGNNLKLLDDILKVLTTTFIDMGCKVESIIVDYTTNKLRDEDYELSLENYEDSFLLKDVKKLIGIDITKKECEVLLNKMMYGIVSYDEKTTKFTVEVPTFRKDIWSSVDIIDDIARAYGYNNIKLKMPNLFTIGNKLEISKFKDNLSDNLTKIGFLELYTYILTSTENQFKRVNLQQDNFKFEKLVDSTDDGINMCRINIFPEILTALQYNKKNKYPQKVFENGFTLQVDKTTETKGRNESRLSTAIADPKSNYTEAKGTLDLLAEIFNWNIEYKISNLAFLIEGRQAEVFIDDVNIGFIGEIHPSVLKTYGFNVPIAIFEINVDKVFKLSSSY